MESDPNNTSLLRRHVPKETSQNYEIIAEIRQKKPKKKMNPKKRLIDKKNNNLIAV